MKTYGIDRLTRIVRDHGGGDAESLRNAIVADVTRFRDKIEQDDDVTVVVCRVGNSALRAG